VAQEVEFVLDTGTRGVQKRLDRVLVG
jgi:hypothetical protein